MITVSIIINGNPIYTRTAVNRGRSKIKPTACVYELDDGKKLLHNPSNGAIPLAIGMLRTIKEIKKSL